MPWVSPRSSCPIELAERNKPPREGMAYWGPFGLFLRNVAVDYRVELVPAREVRVTATVSDHGVRSFYFRKTVSAVGLDGESLGAPVAVAVRTAGGRALPLVARDEANWEVAPEGEPFALTYRTRASLRALAR